MSIFSNLIDRLKKQKRGGRSVSGVVSGASVKNVLDLKERPPLIEFHLPVVQDFYAEHKKNIHIIVSAIVCFSILTSFFRASASVAVFYPQTCLGGWQYPENAQGAPTLADNPPLERYSAENSAVLKNSAADLYCGTFQGSIPNDALPKKFTLSFNWSVDNGTVVHDTPAPVSAPVAPTTTDDSGAVPATSASPATASPVIDDSAIAPAAPSQDPAVVPPSDAQSVTIPDAPTPSDPGPQSFLDMFSPARAHAQDAPADTSSGSEGNVTPVVTDPSPVSDPATPVVTLDQSSVASSDTTADTDRSSPSDAFATVSYTLDGSAWNTLGTVGLSNWQHLSFNLPLGQWEDLSHLQISIAPIQTLDQQPTVYVDGMRISVEYEEGKVFQKPTVVIKNAAAQVLAGNPDFASDETPMFAVVDPNLSTHDIADLVKENKAEVLLDKDGVLSDTPPGSENSSRTKAAEIIKNIFTPSPSTPDVLPSLPLVPESSPSSTDSGTTPTPPSSDVEVIEGPAPAIDALSSDKVFSAPTETVPAAPSAADPVTSFFYSPKSTRRHVQDSFSIFGPLVARADDGVPPGAAPKISSARVLDYYGNPTSIKTSIQSVTINGETRDGVVVEKQDREFRAGRYTLEVTVETADAIIVSQQDFTWGVLAINTDKAIYAEGDNAYLQMGVLDDAGNTLCGADLDLVIKSPSGASEHFTTDDGTLVREVKCGRNNVIDVPDYYAHYQVPSESGTYTMTLIGTTDNGTKKITDTFDVDHPHFNVVRTGPTRFFPPSKYPMTLQITSDSDWKGIVTEIVPSDFVITKSKVVQSYDSVTTSGDLTTISWDVDLKAGQGVSLGYVFKAPDISPQFYLLGPLSFFTDGDDPAIAHPVFRETREWQLAADAVCTAASSGNWNTTGTWSCGHVPLNTDSVVINSGATVTMDVASASSIQGVTINGTLNTITSGTSYALTTTTLTIGSTGTLTANASTITLTGTSGTLFTITAGGTFTQGTSEVVVTSASGSPTLLSAATTFHRLKINAAATVINAGAAITMSSADAANRLYIAAGVLNDGGNQITGTSNGTLILDAGTALCIGGTAAATTATCDSGATPTTATTFPTNYTAGNITLAYGADAVTAPTANLVAHWDASVSSSVHISTNVSQWDDQSGNGNNLTNAFGTQQPTFSGSGTTSLITFDGSDDSLQSSFTLGTTNTVYMYYKTISWSNFKTIFDGYNAVSMVLFMDVPSPNTVQYISGTGGDKAVTIGTREVTTAVYNGASSTLSVNDGTKATGNPGSATAGGFSLGGYSNHTNFANIAVSEVYIYNVAHSAATQTTVVTAIRNKWEGGGSAGSSIVYYNADAAQTISSTPAYGDLKIMPQLTAARTYTFASGSTTINGNFVINPSRSSSALLTVNMGGNITVAADKTTTISNTSSATSTLVTTASNYNLTSGKIVISTGDTLDASSSTSTISLNATSGTLLTNTGTFTQGNSTVSVTSATGPVTLMTVAQTFHGLTINSASSSTVVNAGVAITIEDTSGAALTVTSGVLNDSGLGYTTSGSTNNTLTLGSAGTLCLGGASGSNTSATCNTSATSTTTRAMPSFHTYSLNASSTVIYLSNADTTVTAIGSPGYGNLTFKPTITAARAYTLGSSMIVAGALDSNPQTGAFALTTNIASGGLTVTGLITLEGTTSTSTMTTTGSNYAVTAGSMNVTSGNTFTANGSTITFTGTSGTLLTRGGTFTQGTSTVSVTSASGPVALLSATQTFHILTINSASSSTVVNAGAAITIDDASGAALTITSGVLNDSGSGIATSASTTNTLTLGSGGTLCLGGAAGSNTSATCDTSASSTTARAMPTFHTYSFDAASTVIYLSDAATTVSSSQTYGNLKFMPVLTAARTYTLGGAMTINGTAWSINPNSSGSNLLTVNAAGTMTLPATGTTTIGRQGSTATSKLVLRPASTDYNLSTGLLNVAAGGTLDATSAASTITLSGTSGTLFTLGGTFTITSGTPTVTLSGNGNATLNSGAITFYDLTQSGTGTKTVGAALTINHNLTVSAGTFEPSTFTVTGSGTNVISVASGAALNVGSSTWAGSYASFETRTISSGSTVEYNLAGTQTIDSTLTYSNLTISGASGTKSLNGATTANATLTLSGSATLDTTSASHYDLNAAQLVFSGGTLLGQSSNITVSGTTGTPITYTSGTFTPGTSTVLYTGNNAGGNTTITTAISYYSLTLNNTSETFNPNGTLTLDPAGTLTITLGTLDTTGSNYQISAGHISIANSSSAILTANASAIGLTGTSGTLFTRGASGVFNGGTSAVTLSGNGTATVNSGAFTSGNAFYDLTSSGTGTKTLGADITITDIFGVTGGTFDTSSSNYAITVKNITISASKILIGNGSTITVTGNWTNSGTFTAGTSTVILNGGTTATVSGTTSFYNLTITHTTDKEVDFAASGGTPTYTVSHTLTVTGTSGHPMKLRSATPTTKWDFLPSGTASVNYVDVSDGGCHAGAISISPSNFIDNGNNDACWLTVPPTLTFSISSSSVSLGTLTTSGTGSGSHTLSAATNAASGFSITYNGATLTNGAYTIPAYSSLSSSVAGTAGFGLNLVDTGITTNSGTCAAATDYATSSKYTFIASTTTSVTSVTTPSDCVFTATYKANISSVTAPGSYSTAITYIVTGTF